MVPESEWLIRCGSDGYWYVREGFGSAYLGRYRAADLDAYFDGSPRFPSLDLAQAYTRGAGRVIGLDGSYQDPHVESKDVRTLSPLLESLLQSWWWATGPLPPVETEAYQLWCYIKENLTQLDSE